MLIILHMTDSLSSIHSISAMVEGENLVAKWADYTLFGGLALWIGSLFMNRMQSPRVKQIMLGAALLAGLLLIVAQLPPLFWWVLVNSSSFSWSGSLFFSLHLLIVLVTLWQALVTIYAIEKSLKTI